MIRVTLICDGARLPGRITGDPLPMCESRVGRSPSADRQTRAEAVRAAVYAGESEGWRVTSWGVQCPVCAEMGRSLSNAGEHRARKLRAASP